MQRQSRDSEGQDFEVQVEAIAAQINTFTTQSIAIYNKQYIVPTLDGSLLQITRAGAITPWVDLVTRGWGVPFGLTVQGDSLVATVSGFLGEHFLVRVAADGQVSKLADFEAMVGSYGGPFGVAASTNGEQKGYAVTLSPDTTASQGALLWVSDAR